MSTPSLVTFLSWPKHPVAVQEALNDTQDCPVMPRLDVEQMLQLASTEVGVVEETDEEEDGQCSDGEEVWASSLEW